jgi:hemoglobin
MNEQPLYERLGGFDAVAVATDEVMKRLMDDPQFTRFFSGRGEVSIKRIRQLTVEMICSLTGGPCFYIGSDMKPIHKGRGINEADWQAHMGHLAATLSRFKVPEREQKELLGILSRIKSDIVEKT